VNLNSLEDEAEFMQMLYDNDPQIHLHALDKFKQHKTQKSMAYLKSKNPMITSRDQFGAQTG